MRTAKTQGGFTLIELIVVILLIGILAAVAMPKFIDFGRDARVASILAARGTLAGTANLIHAKYLISGGTVIVMEGGFIVSLTPGGSGYPRADASFAAAAGLGSPDYTITAAGGNLTVTVSTNCSVVYTEPPSAGIPPTFVVTTTGC